MSEEDVVISDLSSHARDSHSDRIAYEACPSGLWTFGMEANGPELVACPR